MFLLAYLFLSLLRELPARGACSSRQFAAYESILRELAR